MKKSATIIFGGFVIIASLGISFQLNQAFGMRIANRIVNGDQSHKSVVLAEEFGTRPRTNDTVTQYAVHNERTFYVATANALASDAERGLDANQVSNQLVLALAQSVGCGAKCS